MAEYTEERKDKVRRFYAEVDALLGLKQPNTKIAQTSHDHEEWARFYLELLTDPEYNRLYNLSLHPWIVRSGRNPMWNDKQLINLARQHMEAAEILSVLDSLHDE